MKVFLLLASMFVFALSAQADTYVTAFGGANWDNVINTNGVYDNTGYVVGGAVGTHVKSIPGLRLEGELAFRQNAVKVFKFVQADHDTYTLMANAVYDLPLQVGPVTPYVLAGVGYGNTQATFTDIALARLEASGVAWQVGVGANIEVADGVKAGIGYRYLQAPEINVLGTQLSDGTNSSVVAGLTFDLN